MFVKVKIPLPLIIKEYRVDDIIVALGLAIEDKQLSIKISRQDSSRCEAPQIVCSILGDLNGYNIKASREEYREEGKKALRILSYIVKDIIVNKTLNMVRALSNTNIDKKDGSILCVISNGGIILSITRDPLNPVCFRIPAYNYYLIEGTWKEKQVILEGLEENIFSVIERLWNSRETLLKVNSVTLKAIAAWSEKDKQYIIVKEKPLAISGLRIFKISSWGLDIDVRF